MSASGKTANYNLPQWGTELNDVPQWIGDMNDAFQIIDFGMNEAKNSSMSVVGIANEATAKVEELTTTVGGFDSRIKSAEIKANNAITTANEALSDVGNAETVANNAMAKANAVDAALHAVQTQVQENTEKLAVIDGTIMAIETTANEAKEEALNASDSVSTLTPKVTALDTRMEMLADKVSTNHDSIILHTNKISQLENSTNSLGETVMSINEEVQELSGEVAKLSTDTLISIYPRFTINGSSEIGTGAIIQNNICFVHAQAELFQTTPISLTIYSDDYVLNERGTFYLTFTISDAETGAIKKQKTLAVLKDTDNAVCAKTGSITQPSGENYIIIEGMFPVVKRP